MKYLLSRRSWLVFLCWFALVLPAVAVADDELPPERVWPASFAELLGTLPETDFSERAEVVQHLAALGDPRSVPVLAALLEGRLFATAETPPRILIAADSGDEASLSDALTAEPGGTVTSTDAERIPVNNSLRGALRSLLATLRLSDPDPAVRLDAANQLIDGRPDADTLTLLRERLGQERDRSVRGALQTVLALTDLESAEPARRLVAVEHLADKLHPAVLARLSEVAAGDAEANIRTHAAEAVEAIRLKSTLYRLVESVFFGLSLGSILLLAAVGLAITFGVMGVINMAHGELMMLGAYTTWGIQQLLPGHHDSSLLLAIPAAFMVSALVGIAIERGVIRFLYGRPLETLLATFGLSLVLQQAVRSIFSPLNRAVVSPSWMSGSLQLNPVLSLTCNRLFILGFGLLVFWLLMLVLNRTSYGLRVRAVAQNRPMARACGVASSRVDALTFGLGAGIAGVAGVALSQLTNVGPNLGQGYIIDSFMVVVFGGVGNLWGTLVGAFGLGIANKFLEPLAGAVLAKIFGLLFIILFIQKRPRGLFPQKGRSAEG